MATQSTLTNRCFNTKALGLPITSHLNLVKIQSFNCLLLALEARVQSHTNVVLDAVSLWHFFLPTLLFSPLDGN